MKYDIVSVRSTRTPYKVSRPVDVYAALKRYANSKVEKFFAISLDNQHAILHINMVSVGTTNRCIVHPREVYLAAIKDSATALIVAHPHPSTCTTPSEDDKNITIRLRDAGELIGIPLLDHIVFSRTGYFSFVEGGLLSAPSSD
jgi:DNA repair protein RadC